MYVQTMTNIRTLEGADLEGGEGAHIHIINQQKLMIILLVVSIQAGERAASSCGEGDAHSKVW